jgi:hypothetical protein
MSDLSDITFEPATGTATLRYAVLYGDVPRFKWQPRSWMRWRIFRKTAPIAWADFETAPGSTPAKP